MKANNNYTMLFKPLSFVFDDETSKEIEDQLIFSDEIMLTPVYEQNKEHRYIYYPKRMLSVKMNSFNDYEMAIKINPRYKMAVQERDFLINELKRLKK